MCNVRSEKGLLLFFLRSHNSTYILYRVLYTVYTVYTYTVDI